MAKNYLLILILINSYKELRRYRCNHYQHDILILCDKPGFLNKTLNYT